MGAREDFNQAMNRGDFAAAARVWSSGALPLDESVAAFQAKLEASLENRQHVVGESLTVASGEYSYLGNVGKDGSRLAYLPHNGSLDGITYLRNHDEVVAHLVSTGAAQLDLEAVVAFFAVSEHRSSELSQTAVQEELSPEDAIREIFARRGDSPELVESIVALAKQDFKNERVHVGHLSGYGRAPYKNEPKNTRNYFVSLVGPDGHEETIWGKELEAAIVDEGLNTGGDFNVVLSHQGVQDVTVRVPELDAKGAPTGRSVDAPARRNQWKALSLDALRQQVIEQLFLQDVATMPAPVAAFKKRLHNATWFWDTDEEVSQAGEQSIGQLREDFKALMIEYPVEAAEVWRSVAPAEYQGELVDLLAQLESVAPEVIKAHKDHDQAEAMQQDGEGDSPIHDSIQAAPSTVKPVEKETDDSIQQIVVGQGEHKPQNSGIDAIARIAAGNADTISNAGSGKEAGPGVPEAQQDASAGAPKSLLNGRFILRDHGQYFRVADGVESTRVALVDEASKIRFVDKQMDTFQAAIELAKHKQWEAILVTGSEKFRAEAWHHARMAGLEVVGYEPSEKDMATLKAAQDGRAAAPLAKSETAPANIPVDVSKVKSLQAAKDQAIRDGYGVSDAKIKDGRHIGKIIHETDKHVVQDVGRKVAVVHDKDSFDKRALRTSIENKKSFTIQYDNGRAGIEGGKERSQVRGR